VLLVFDHVDTTGSFVKAGIEDGFQIDGQELVSVSLLTYSVAAPDRWKRPDNRLRSAPSVFGERGNILDIAALVASLWVAFALLRVALTQTKPLQG